jgi:hypothetical protein
MVFHLKPSPAGVSLFSSENSWSEILKEQEEKHNCFLPKHWFLNQGTTFFHEFSMNTKRLTKVTILFSFGE